MTGLFEELADNVPAMLWRSRLDMQRDFFNKPWLDFTGRTHEQEFGTGWVQGVHADDDARRHEIYGRAFKAREKFTVEYRLRRHDGEYRWIVDNGAPFLRDGVFAGYFGSCIDISARREDEDGRRTLLAELNHRVKNMLATVQALAHQSCARVGTPREAEELLNGRLMALSQAHEILAEQNWRGAEIGQVLRRIVSLASRDPERVRMEGQPAFLRPPVAQSLAMAFYELSLNAMQYGALSSSSGVVGIDWKPVYRDGTTWLDIVWRETGGPAVEPPESHGLGVRLIRSMLPLEIAGKTEIEFPNDGVVCHIRIPMAGGLQ